jgi:hypothetical protein
MPSDFRSDRSRLRLGWDEMNVCHQPTAHSARAHYGRANDDARHTHRVRVNLAVHVKCLRWLNFFQMISSR